MLSDFFIQFGTQFLVDFMDGTDDVVSILF